MKVLSGWKKVYEKPKGFTVFKNIIVFGRQKDFGTKEIHLTSPKITSSRTPGDKSSRKWGVRYVEHSYSAPNNYWRFGTKIEAEKKVLQLMHTK